MAFNDEFDLGLMAKIKDIPEEVAESSSSSASTSATQVPISSNSSDSLSALDSLTVDLYNALNGKTKAESENTDLRDQLSTCHQWIKELTIFEENMKDEVFVNQLLCVEREKAIAEREKALAELIAEKNTVLGWCGASVKVDKIIQSQRPIGIKNCIGFSRKKNIGR